MGSQNQSRSRCQNESRCQNLGRSLNLSQSRCRLPSQKHPGPDPWYSAHLDKLEA